MHFDQNLFGKPSGEKLCCFKNELIVVNYLSTEELFGGYDTIKAITFSYDLKFIDKLLENFANAKVIIGGAFFTQKDINMQKLLAAALADVEIAAKEVGKFEKLLEMMREQRLEFRVPLACIDHRKIYILSNSKNGATRAISSSANMSARAWDGNQIENYSYDDTPFCFDEYSKRFDTFYSCCKPLPLEVIATKHTDNPFESNAIIKEIKEKNEVIVLERMHEDIEPDSVRYAIDYEKIKGKYDVLVGDVNLKNKHGLFEISPKTLKKFELNLNKESLKAKNLNPQADYPRLKFDYENLRAFIDDEELNLEPSSDEVRRDINELLALLENFNDFVGDQEKIKHTHFKLLNAVFASPFHAKIRCTAHLKNISTTSLPMFLLAVSSTANCGKTFVITAILKMMSGKRLVNLNTKSCKSTFIKDIQAGYSSLPVFIDEIDNAYIGFSKGTIKNSEECETNQLQDQPMIVFASNDALDPDETLRKRMIFLRFEGALPSDIDQNAYKGRGNAIISRLSNALYREYLRRILPKISELLDTMIQGGLEDTWYPDVMLISSKVLLEILDDFGYAIPSYMRPLSFNADYSVNAGFIAQDSLNEIAEFYKHNKSAFKIDKKQVTIELGTDSDSKNKCKNWANTLPAEMKAKILSTKDKNQLILDRAELEKRLGIKFGGFGFFTWS